MILILLDYSTFWIDLYLSYYTLVPLRLTEIKIDLARPDLCCKLSQRSILRDEMNLYCMLAPSRSISNDLNIMRLLRTKIDLACSDLCCQCQLRIISEINLKRWDGSYCMLVPSRSIYTYLMYSSDRSHSLALIYSASCESSWRSILRD